MADADSAEVSGLLGASDPAAREVAWAAFLNVHSRLLLYVARTVASDHDSAMDAYAYLLEQLRAGDCRRLRSYTADGRSKFTTWLVVVARRLCLDHFRQRYGRPRAATGQAERHRLVDLIASDVDLTQLPDPKARDPAVDLERAERVRALERALGRLDPQDCLLLKLRFQDDLSAREIAGLMSFASPFHVYRRLNRLLAVLRTDLHRRGIEETTP